MENSLTSILALAYRPMYNLYNYRLEQALKLRFHVLKTRFFLVKDIVFMDKEGQTII